MSNDEVEILTKQYGGLSCLECLGDLVLLLAKAEGFVSIEGNLTDSTF